MKKVFLTILAVSLTSFLFAQGTVQETGSTRLLQKYGMKYQMKNDATSITAIPMTLTRQAGQTTDLFQITDESDNVLCSVNAYGTLYAQIIQAELDVDTYVSLENSRIYIRDANDQLSLNPTTISYVNAGVPYTIYLNWGVLPFMGTATVTIPGWSGTVGVLSKGASPPGAGDCDADVESGRMHIDTANNRLYICMGLARGWDYTALTD